MENSTYQIYTIRRLTEMASDGSLDLDPDWQRGSIWTRDQKPKLIDSIQNGYPIPPLVIWTRPQGKYIMVDGKQRTEALIGYTKDEFAFENTVYSQKSQSDKETFLDKEINVLVFKACVDEDFIVEYFERINTESKQLSNGEMINCLCAKPIVSSINNLFFQPGSFRDKWVELFGEPNEEKRMKHYENTVPYLTSSLHGIKYLTKSFPTIAPVIKSTDQAKLDEHMYIFESRIDLLINVVKAIFEVCPQLKPQWTKQGLPPIRQISPIWVTIINPEHYTENLITFWAAFYKNMNSKPITIKPQWELYMRKNGKPQQIYKEINYAMVMYNAE
jgi:hypothetical protein